MSHDADVAIIGAGVVGLAIALQLASEKREVFLLEQHDTFGLEQTARTGGGTHAAWFFVPHADDLKARLTVHGKEKIIAFIDEYQVPHDIHAALMALTTNKKDIDIVQKMFDIGNRYGGECLRLLDRDGIKKEEPYVNGEWAIHCPNLRTVEPTSLLKVYASLAAQRGAQLAFKNKVIGVDKVTEGYKVTVMNGNERSSFTTRIVINAAGLNSEKVAQMAGIDTAKAGYKLSFHRAEEFTVGKPKSLMLKSVIDTIKSLNGPHISSYLDGRMRIGHHIRYLKEGEPIDYAMGEENKQFIFNSVKEYLPFLEIDDLNPEFAAIHDELLDASGMIGDWHITEESGRGLPGFVNLLGMDAPAFTTSLAIAEHVESLIKDQLN